MGSLVKNIGHSEINATLELLDQYGVTVGGLKRLRGKASPAVIKQLVRFIETGTVGGVVAMSAFTTFTAMIGSPDLDKVEHQWVCVGKRYIDNLAIDGLKKLLPKLPPQEESFIIMGFGDFTKSPIPPTLGQLTNRQWLRQWSEMNLAGFNLELCRKDTAPYLAHLRGKLWKHGELWVATEPLCDKGPKTMLRLEDCDNGVLRLRLMEYNDNDILYCGYHIVFQIGKR